MLTRVIQGALLVALIPTVAHAGKGGISATGQLQLLPLGSNHVEAGTFEEDFDLGLAFAFGAQVDYWVTDQITVGLAPRYILGIKPDDAMDDEDSVSELDIAVRAQYNHQVNPQLQAFGFVAPGYSIIMLPEDAGDQDNPAGLILGFGAGARYGINDKLFAQGELGYQLGFQGVSQDVGGTTVDATFSTNFLHIGVGVGSHF